MKKTNWPATILFHQALIGTLLLLTSCSIEEGESRVVPTGTLEAVASQIALPEQLSPPQSTATPPIIAAGPSLTPSPSPTPLSAFRLTPREPFGPASFMTDPSSAALADEKRTIGDHFEGNLFERPHSVKALAYKPFIDINPGAEISLDPPWIYFTIDLVEAPYSWQEAHYGVEIDQDFDGRGDVLIASTFPTSTSWSREGVNIFTDTNGDVGGEVPIQSDDHPGDGYDTLIFGDITGLDPDTAWIRRHPRDESSLQFAVKQSLLNRGWHFAWGAWAIGGSLHPENFDFNDQYTIEEAGSPLGYSRHYPPLGLVEIDNTCRSIAGGAPSGAIPGLCPMARPTSIATPLPSATPAP